MTLLESVKYAKDKQTTINKQTTSIDETVADDIVVEEKTVVEEKGNNLSPYTLPLTLSFVMLYGPFFMWMVRAPYGIIIGEGVVGAILLITGAFFAIWKKLCWPKDKWLWIATILIVVLLLSNIIGRLVGYGNIFLLLSAIFFYLLWTLYFGIRFWQANKK